MMYLIHATTWMNTEATPSGRAEHKRDNALYGSIYEKCLNRKHRETESLLVVGVGKERGT